MCECLCPLHVMRPIQHSVFFELRLHGCCCLWRASFYCTDYIINQWLTGSILCWTEAKRFNCICAFFFVYLCMKSNNFIWNRLGFMCRSQRYIPSVLGFNSEHLSWMVVLYGSRPPEIPPLSWKSALIPIFKQSFSKVSVVTKSPKRAALNLISLWYATFMFFYVSIETLLLLLKKQENFKASHLLSHWSLEK